MDPSTILPLELLSLITNLLDISSLFALSLTSKFYNKPGFHITLPNKKSIIQDTICNRYENLLRWVLPPNERDSIFDYDAMMTLCVTAASSNDLKILQYVIGRRDMSSIIFRLSERILVAAAAKGNLEMVKYLCEEKKCYWGDGKVCYTAANNNHLIVQYLREHGCPYALKGVISSFEVCSF